MLNLFKKQENKEVYHAPYRPSWEESARAWQENHIAHKSSLNVLRKN